MKHSYALTELHASPMSTMPIGSIFYLLGSRDSSLYLKINAPEQDGMAWLVKLDDKLTVLRLDATHQQNPVLPLPPGQLRIAITSAFKRDLNQVAGSVLVSNEGAVLVGTGHDRHGFSTEHYISASTWNIVDIPNNCWTTEGTHLAWHPSELMLDPIVLWSPAAQAP
jgi:hypothetical protein